MSLFVCVPVRACVRVCVQGVSACQAPGFAPCTLYLRAGTFYLSATVNLGPADSGLTISAYNGEEVWVSGGVPLTGVTWKPYNTSGTVWQVGTPSHARFVPCVRCALRLYTAPSVPTYPL
jgi:hypothetical protein